MTLSEYEQALERARAKLEAIRSQIASLGQEEQELVPVVRGWEAIIAMERKQAGQGGAPAESSPSPDMSASEEELPGGDLGDEEADGGKNKTQFVRDFIKAHASEGTQPGDLRRAADRVGMKYPASWPYGPLQRLKKKGEIIKRRGKFYPNPPEGQQPPLALVG